jgi:hypothetical protein
VFCLRNRVARFRSATAPDSRSDDEAMSFIVRRSDTEDGAVPPEPIGPMEVPGRGSRTVPVGWNAKSLSNRPFPCRTSIGDGNPISETGH